MTTAATTEKTAETATAPATAAATTEKPAQQLDKFLDEFATAAAPAKPAAAITAPATTAPATTASPAATSAPSSDLERRLAAIEPEIVELRREKANKEIENVVETVRSSTEFLKGVKPSVVFGYLQGLGAKDQRFRNAYLQRQQKPDAWNSVLKAAAASLEEDLKPVADTSAPGADTRAAVLAAARQTGTAPSGQAVKPEDLRKMSDRDLKAFKRQLLAAGRR